MQNELTAYLKKHWQTPEEYILSKFQARAVIFLAEDHAIRHNLLLVQGLIPRLHQAGVYHLGMEFGASEDQEALDALVTAPEYIEDQARRLMFNYNSGWAYQEYLDIYRAAWQWNSSLPEGVRPFRVLNLSYRYDWKGSSAVRTPENAKKIFHLGSTERHRANLVQREILAKGEKILVLTGTPHAFTRYRMPIFDAHTEGFIRWDEADFGHLVYRMAPEKVFTILLHQPFESKLNGWSELVLPAGGEIDRALRGFRDRRVGFDLGDTPFGRLPDDSYYASGSQYFTLGQLADGYIYEKPVAKFEGCRIDELFLNEANWPEALAQFPDPDWHARPASLEAYWAQIRRYVDIAQRYQFLRR